MRCQAVVVAAGEGRRFGSELPKQFQPLAGTPVVLHSCRLLAEHPRVDSLVLVLPGRVMADPPGWMEDLPAGTKSVEGGATRTASVRRGLHATESRIGTILVHDAVRPLTPASVVDRVVRAGDRGAVIPVIPVTDTVKRVDSRNRVVQTVDRSRLRLVQTPQAFPSGILSDVLERARAEDRTATDEAGLCERYGIPVQTVDGHPHNLKITRPGDLALAERILEARRSGALETEGV